MVAALVVILLLILLFGGLGLYISKLFLLGILVVVLIGLAGGGYHRSRRH